MKKTIDALVALAKKYVEYGKVHKFKNDAFTWLHNGEVIVYFADDKNTQSVSFIDKIEIRFWYPNITIPLDYGKNELKAVLDKFTALYETLEK